MDNSKNRKLEAILESPRERKNLDFKEAFDPTSAQDWCEIIKDIIAFANSGGGFIIVGLDNAGEPSGNDVSEVLKIDLAVISDKLRKYTNTDFCDVEIVEKLKQSQRVAIFDIGESSVPIVFTSPGTYGIENGKQTTAFGRGTIYFRHGAKSEPGTTDDIRNAIDRRLSSIRREWLSGVKQVTKAPEGSIIQVIRPDSLADSGTTSPIRITNDPSAKTFGFIDPNIRYPYRRKEVISLVSEAFVDGFKFNGNDFLALRRVHEIDLKPDFFYKPKFGSPQYSKALVDWLISQLKQDHNLFANARIQYDQFKS